MLEYASFTRKSLFFSLLAVIPILICLCIFIMFDPSRKNNNQDTNNSEQYETKIEQNEKIED